MNLDEARAIVGALGLTKECAAVARLAMNFARGDISFVVDGELCEPAKAKTQAEAYSRYLAFLVIALEAPELQPVHDEIRRPKLHVVR